MTVRANDASIRNLRAQADASSDKNDQPWISVKHFKG